jgi:hypothetical protein
MDQLPPRRGSVITAAILIFIYGAFSLVCGFCGMLSMAANDPAMAEMIAKEAPLSEFLSIGSTISSLFIGVVMILLGLFVLQLKPLARIGVYVACTYDILMLLVIGVHSVFFVFPVTEKFFQEQAKNNPQGGAEFVTFMQGILWFQLLLAAVLTLGLCGTIIILLSGARARAAFADEFEAPDAPRRRRRYYDDDDDDDDYLPPSRSGGDTGITDRPT